MAASAGEYSVDEDDQLQPEDTLVDRGVADVLDEGYSPPEQPYRRGSLGSTPEWLEQLLAEEELDPATRLYDPFDTDELQRSDEAERETEFLQHDEVGRTRAGRLVAPDQGFGEDVDADRVADDVGIDGGAASAEEAAVHVIEDEELAGLAGEFRWRNNVGCDASHCSTVCAPSGGSSGWSGAVCPCCTGTTIRPDWRRRYGCPAVQLSESRSGTCWLSRPGRGRASERYSAWPHPTRELSPLGSPDPKQRFSDGTRIAHGMLVWLRIDL